MTATTVHLPRRLSPDAEPMPRGLGLLAAQVRAELIRVLRAPDYLAAVVVLPTVLFLLFGVPNASVLLPDGTTLGRHIVPSFGVYGLLSTVLFAFGEGIANERGQGWLRLMRAAPLPAWLFLAGKLVVGLVTALAVVGLLFTVAALVAGIGMTPVEWLLLGVILVTGAAVLAPIGFLIGFWVRPSSAGAVSLLLLLPISYLSGSWQPVETLPEGIRGISAFLPTFHYAQLARAAVGVPVDGLALHAAWVVGSGVVLGAVALWGYRRAAGTQFA